MNEDRDMDNRLRALFEPDGNAVERLVVGALKTPHDPWPEIEEDAVRSDSCRDSCLRDHAGKVQCPFARTQDQLIITPVGDVVLVQSSSGDSWIIGPSGRTIGCLPDGICHIGRENEMNRPSSYAGMAALVFLLSSMSRWAQTDWASGFHRCKRGLARGCFQIAREHPGLRIVVDPEVKKPVTMRVADVTARTALN